MLKSAPKYPAVLVHDTGMSHSATFGKIQQQYEPKPQSAHFMEYRSFTMNLSSIRERID